MTRALALGILAMTALVACDSPEAARQRGGGAGADVGNRGPVGLHAGADPYYGTPYVMPRAAASGGGDVAASPRGR